MDKSEIAYRIRRLQGDEETDFDFARRLGVSRAELEDFLDDQTPPLERLIALSRRTGIGVGWLVTGEGPVWLAETFDRPAEDVVFVPWLRAYRGKHDPSPQVKRVPLALPRSIVVGLAADVERLRLVSVPGDAMEPTLAAGGIAIVDTSVDDFVDDGIYAFLKGDDVVVRRVQRKLGEGTNLLCDNPSYRDEELSVEDRGYVEVAGRVVWHAARL